MFLRRIILIIIILLSLVGTAAAQKITTPSKVKFYNFDDLLIDGKIRKPQVLWTDARQKVKFERLLKLKKDFIPKLKKTKKDPSLR